MKNNIFLKSLISVLFIVIVLFPSCKKDNTKSPTELFAEEMDILERFKETETYKSWFDEAELVIDSSDAESSYHGLVYFQLEKGWGDTVQLGKMVGIRYTMYYILDSVGADEPFLVEVMSNISSANPIVYQVGNPDTYSGIYYGLDYGIRWMHCYGKSRMLFPSTLGGNDYVSRVMEVEITYMSK
ncbi:MAG: hypothetical protein GXO47_10325 [Chlorobi bacterium]|nr:hypothetical protein [Chlorobiota bacterium]